MNIPAVDHQHVFERTDMEDEDEIEELMIERLGPDALKTVEEQVLRKVVDRLFSNEVSHIVSRKADSGSSVLDDVPK